MNRRKLDAADGNLILHEFKKHINPLVDPSLELINIVNRKVADDSINVADTVNIGEEMTKNFVNSLPENFYKAIQALFNRLLIVGQNRNTSLVSVFEYELCAVPYSIIDEFGFIRKVNKANIVKKLAIISTEPCPPDEVIVDGGQLLYHIVWPCGGTISTLTTGMATRLNSYSVIPTNRIFARYGNVSAKDHERSHRAGGVFPAEYNLTLTSPLPNRHYHEKQS